MDLELGGQSSVLLGILLAYFVGLSELPPFYYNRKH